MAVVDVDWDPSIVHPALSPEFLTPIADRIWAVQQKVAKHVRPDQGDNEWVAGCTAYRRRCYALERMQLEPAYKPWLWAGMLDGHFSIRIHGFPVRIYRAPSEGDVPESYVDAAQMELDLLAFALGVPSGNAPPFIYRIEVLTVKYARPARIALVQVNASGKIKSIYTIPRTPSTARGTADVRPIRERKPGVVPPIPSVGPSKEKEVQITAARKETPA